MTTIVDLPDSTATLLHSVSGDIGGNAQETTIEVISDGGQFPMTEVEKTETGFKIKIIGAWEASEFIEAMRSLS